MVVDDGFGGPSDHIEVIFESFVAGGKPKGEIIDRSFIVLGVFIFFHIVSDFVGLEDFLYLLFDHFFDFLFIWLWHHELGHFYEGLEVIVSVFSQIDAAKGKIQLEIELFSDCGAEFLHVGLREV